MEQTEQTKINEAAITRMPWWNLLLFLWNAAEVLQLPWAAGFDKRITIRELSKDDFEWLVNAMGHTMAKLPEPMKEIILPEFRTFQNDSKIYNWWLTYQDQAAEIEQGPEGTALISGPGYSLPRTARGKTLEELTAHLCKWPAETIARWIYKPAVFAGQFLEPEVL